jgi:hypothetical protein
LSFAETPQAQVDVRLDGRIVATHMLSEAQPVATFRRRLDKAVEDAQESPKVEARTTWFLAGGKRVEGAWLPVEGTTLLVHRPWRSSRTLRLIPLLPENFIDALVTLTIKEPTRSQSVEARFEPGDRRAKTIELPSLLEQPPGVQIDTLVVRGDGSTFASMPLTTSDPVVLIRDRDGVQRQVSVRLLAGTTLAVHGLMAVQVLLEDEDGETIDSVVFTESRRNPGMLLVPVVTGQPPPKYRVVRYAIDGSASKGESESLPAGELLVSAAAR